MDKATVLRILLAVLYIAEEREVAARIFLNGRWRQNIKLFPVDVLLKRFKYIISICSLRTILYMYKIGIFEDEKEIISAVGECIIKRDMQTAWQVRCIMLQNQFNIGKILSFYIFEY